MYGHALDHEVKALMSAPSIQRYQNSGFESGGKHNSANDSKQSLLLLLLVLLLGEVAHHLISNGTPNGMARDIAAGYNSVLAVKLVTSE